MDHGDLKIKHMTDLPNHLELPGTVQEHFNPVLAVKTFHFLTEESAAIEATRKCVNHICCSAEVIEINCRLWPEECGFPRWWPYYMRHLS